ncbi:MAG: hypothetical protein CM15mP32_4710 [Flavobacteriaceae bacterium]|nr:MAG: hypothetical protein CM15mP32_4710 [Flavobacteriaceae bacterium]
MVIHNYIFNHDRFLYGLEQCRTKYPLENVGSNDDNSDSDEIEDEEEEEEEYTSLNNTIVPEYSILIKISFGKTFLQKDHRKSQQSSC